MSPSDPPRPASFLDRFASALARVLVVAILLITTIAVSVMVQAGDRSGPGSIGAPESFAEIRVGIRTCPDDVSSTDLRVLATACITEHGTYGVPLGLVTAGGTPSFQYTSAANRAVVTWNPVLPAASTALTIADVAGVEREPNVFCEQQSQSGRTTFGGGAVEVVAGVAAFRVAPGDTLDCAWFRFPGGVAAAEPGTTAGVIDVAAVAANTTRPARTPGASPRELTTVTPRPTRSSSTATPFAPASIPANATRIPRVSPTATRFPATATATPTNRAASTATARPTATATPTRFVSTATSIPTPTTTPTQAAATATSTPTTTPTEISPTATNTPTTTPTEISPTATNTPTTTPTEISPTATNTPTTTPTNTSTEIPPQVSLILEITRPRN